MCVMFIIRALLVWHTHSYTLHIKSEISVNSSNPSITIHGGIAVWQPGLPQYGFG